MERKSTSEETQGLSADDLCDHRPQTACGGLKVGRARTARARAGEGGRWEYPLNPALAGGVGVSSPLPALETVLSSRSPGAIRPGIFFDLRRDAQTFEPDEDSGDEPLPEGTDAEQFHDSELGDIYDLYNACNGAMLGELLDVRKLDELSPAETEALDVGRLREVWEHTATSCATCARIVRTLNKARGALRAGREGDDAPEH